MADRHIGWWVAVVAAFLCAAPASATPMQAVFTGTIVGTEGTVDVAGFFGAPDGNLTGSAYTAKFIYDLSVSPPISGTGPFASFVTSQSVLSAVVTINGHALDINADPFFPGRAMSSLWDTPGQMFGKAFEADANRTETIGNTTYVRSLVDQVFSDQVPLLSLTTPFSSDNANFPLTGEDFSGSLFLSAIGGMEYGEIFDFLASSVVVSPVRAQVPEPWTAAVFGTDLAGLALLRRRRAAKASRRR